MNRFGQVFVIVVLMSLFLITYHIEAEIRGVWITTNYQLDWPTETGVTPVVIKRQQQELIHMLDRLQEAGINTIFFQARLKGAVFYHSQIEHQSRYLTGNPKLSSQFDALAFVVDECHRRNMECHAWMVCIPIGSRRYLEQNGLLSFFQKNRSWISACRGEYYLEPSALQTSNYLASIAEEIARYYDVDGIHLDYIRYPEHAADYPDQSIYRQSQTTLSLSDWRRENITRIVYTIYDRVKSVRANVKVSSAPLGLFNGRLGDDYFGWNAFDSGYQDVERWMHEGKQDFIVPMMYYKDRMFYPFVIDWCRRSKGCPVVAGLGIYRLYDNSLWNRQDIENQIWWSRRLGASGYALFRAGNFLHPDASLFWGVKTLNVDDDMQHISPESEFDFSEIQKKTDYLHSQFQ